jgi:hypothetical protein
VDKLHAAVTDSSGIIAASVSSSHNGANSTATVECTATNLDISSPISVVLGYDGAGNSDTLFTGYVKNIELSASPKIYTITAADILIRAQEYFVISNNPEDSLQYNNAAPEDIIHDLMDMAGITDYDGDSSSYIWGVNGPIKITQVTAYDYSKFLADLIAWQIYADENGTVHFQDRRPYPMGGDTAVGTLTYANSTIMKYWKSDKDLRNKIVVWGTTGVYAHAERSDSYDPISKSYIQVLPDYFYKTTAVSSQVIDTQEMAQSACDFNLVLYNRLNVGISVSTIGNSDYKCRKTINVTAPELGLGNNPIEFYIYQTDHQWSSQGYQVNMELRV